MNSEKIYQEIKESNKLLKSWLEAINTNLITTNKILRKVFEDKLEKKE